MANTYKVKRSNSGLYALIIDDSSLSKLNSILTHLVSRPQYTVTLSDGRELTELDSETLLKLENSAKAQIQTIKTNFLTKDGNTYLALRIGRSRSYETTNFDLDLNAPEHISEKLWPLFENWLEGIRQNYGFLVRMKPQDLISSILLSVLAAVGISYLILITNIITDNVSLLRFFLSYLGLSILWSIARYLLPTTIYRETIFAIGLGLKRYEDTKSMRMWVIGIIALPALLTVITTIALKLFGL